MSVNVAPVTERRPTIVLFTVLLPFGAGYFLANLLRTVNAVIAPDLAADFGLTASDLGLLTSAYLIAFAAPQLPLGFALDRFGPKRVQSALLMMAAGGILVFALADDAVWLTIARAAMGIGMAGCFMAALKANALWWPARRLPMVNGVTAAFGMLGSLSSTVPVELLLPVLGWRGVFEALSAATLALGLIMLALTPERRPATAAQAGFGGQLRELGEVCRNRFFWRFGILAIIHSGTYLAYQSLWTGPWLRDVAGLDRGGVANGLMAFSTGMFIGSLGFGAIAERLQRRGVGPIAVMGVGIGLSIATQSLFALGITALPITMCFLFGLFCSSWFIVFTVVRPAFSDRYPRPGHDIAELADFRRRLPRSVRNRPDHQPMVGEWVRTLPARGVPGRLPRDDRPAGLRLWLGLSASPASTQSESRFADAATLGAGECSRGRRA